MAKIEVDEKLLNQLLELIQSDKKETDKRMKRPNGKGTVAHLSGNRTKPYASRLMIGKDIHGTQIYLDIDTFETELEAIVCLENYHKNPYPLKVEKEKYDRIVIFPQNPYNLVPVENIQSAISRKDKRYYTFRQVFQEMKDVQFPTKQEEQLEKEYHIKPARKICLPQCF